MHRPLVLIAALLILAPPVTAHEGSDLWPLYVAWTEVTTEDPLHSFPLLFPESLQTPGGLLSVAVQNEGPAALTVRIVDGPETFAEWPVPADGNPHTLHYVLAEATNLTLQFESTDPDQSAMVGFMFDMEPACDVGQKWYCSKRLPFEMDGAVMVVPMPVEAPGTYRVNVANNDLHELELAVWDPAMSTRVAVTEQTNSQGNMILEWTAPSPGDYHVVLTSTAIREDVFFDAYSTQGAGAAYETMRVTVLAEGPFGQGAPAPATPLAALAMLALALLVRSKHV